MQPRSARVSKSDLRGKCTREDRQGLRADNRRHSSALVATAYTALCAQVGESHTNSQSSAMLYKPIPLSVFRTIRHIWKQNAVISGLLLHALQTFWANPIGYGISAASSNSFTVLRMSENIVVSSLFVASEGPLSHTASQTSNSLPWWGATEGRQNEIRTIERSRFCKTGGKGPAAGMARRVPS